LALHSALVGLRAATQEIHERLHVHPAFAPLFDTPPDLPGYARLIVQLCGFHAPTEAWLFEAAGRLIPELQDLPRRRKAHLLRADLATLSAILPGLQCDRTVSLELWDRLTRPTVLGCLYVTEGSTLGGRELGRRIQPALQSAGTAGTEGCRFFNAYRSMEGEMWRQFCSVLGAAASQFSPSECRDMQTGARDLFLALEGWLTRSLDIVEQVGLTVLPIPLPCAATPG
jgi:heme oxygenase (biliverdin-IX-beta and delta-forming)